MEVDFKGDNPEAERIVNQFVAVDFGNVYNVSYEEKEIGIRHLVYRDAHIPLSILNDIDTLQNMIISASGMYDRNKRFHHHLSQLTLYSPEEVTADQLDTLNKLIMDIRKDIPDLGRELGKIEHLYPTLYKRYSTAKKLAMDLHESDVVPPEMVYNKGITDRVMENQHLRFGVDFWMTLYRKQMNTAAFSISNGPKSLENLKSQPDILIPLARVVDRIIRERGETLPEGSPSTIANKIDFVF